MNINKNLTKKISNQGKKYKSYQNNIKNDVFNNKYNYLLEKNNSNEYLNNHTYEGFENNNKTTNDITYNPEKDLKELSILENKLHSLIKEYKILNKSNINNITNKVKNSTLSEEQIKKHALSNVYVSKISDLNSSYVGCYNDTSNRALSTFNEQQIYNYETCKEAAIQGGFKYFGLQDYNSNGLAQCGFSNDIDSITQYGEGINYEVSTIWSVSVNNSNGVYMVLQNNGDINFYDQSNVFINNLSTLVKGNSKIYINNDFINNCINGGTITNVNATYGYNCNTDGYPSTSIYNVPSNNVGSIIDKSSKNKSQFLYNIGVDSNGVWEDPAPGCLKNFQMSYNCGTITKVVNLPQSPNIDKQPVLLDCTDVTSNCKSYLILQNDGNLVIYQGTQPSSTTGLVIFTTKTNGVNRVPNKNYVSTNGKTGNKWLASGTGLMAGEWIGSDDGSIYLIMDNNGTLSLNVTTNTSEKCKKLDDGNYYGGSWSNSIYKIKGSTDASVLGKVGYVDKDLNLKEYSPDMLTLGFDYDKIKNYDSEGNNISGYDPLTNLSVGDCKLKCNSLSECYGFSYDTTDKSCYLKNSNTYPKSLKTPSQTNNLFIRKPVIKNNYENSYEEYLKYNINGGNIGEIPIPNSNPSSCETSCNNNSLCAGYVYDNSNNNCYLKNYIDKDSISNSENTNLYVRNIKNSTCSKTINDISSKNWSKDYILTNDFITPQTECSNNLLNNEEKGEMEELNSQINYTVELINEKIKYLKSKNIQLNNDIFLYSKQFKDYINEINDFKKKSTKIANDYTTSTMLSDSDLIVLQSNYKFIMFGILSVIVIIVTMSQSKK